MLTKSYLCDTMETKEKQREDHIVSLVRQFCQEKLDDEYAQLCEKMVRRLGPDTLATGRPEVWAAAVVYAVGSINFLYDHRFQPYIRSVEISRYFGCSQATVAQKARYIRDLLHLSRFWTNPEFSTQYIKAQNPFKRLLMQLF